MSRILTIQQRLNSFIRLGEQLRAPDGTLAELINRAYQYNAWFTPENTKKAVAAIGEMLRADDLATWLEKYDSLGPKSEEPDLGISHFQPRKIGLVLAGNIPLVGFHDVLSVLAAGHIALIKLSSQDQKLLPHILSMLIEIEPGFAGQIQFVERLEKFDAVIATGSTNTSRYFEYYFGKVPNIIRKNRNSVAVLTGKETREDLVALGHDIFDYYGLGCRNVSKIFIPKGFNFSALFEAIEQFSYIGDHHKYNNNYDYNKSILLLNKIKHLDNGFLLVREDESLTSSLAVLHYEEYTDLKSVSEKLRSATNQIQCIVTNENFETKNEKINFGESQSPRLWNYADGIDTMKFLTTLQ